MVARRHGRSDPPQWDEDTGPPHDPFGAVAAPDEATTVEDRPVGGLGVLLVAAMATGVVYRRVDGRNRVSLVIGEPD